jgi:hypothetical protein
LPKQQTGLRIDRVLFKQFQQLCTTEKLRVGEAVESLIRLAVDAGKITGLDFDRENSGRMVDEALFRSRLTRLKTSLELEERYLKETGEELVYKESESLVQELRDLGRRSISPELVKEFEVCLTYADKIYEQSWKNQVEHEIDPNED